MLQNAPRHSSSERKAVFFSSFHASQQAQIFLYQVPKYIMCHSWLQTMMEYKEIVSSRFWKVSFLFITDRETL